MRPVYFAVLFTVACGGTTLPQDDAGTVPDSEVTADAGDAAMVAPDADADAGCMQCVAAGWVNVCAQIVSTNAESCLRCGTWCDSGPVCACAADGRWCGGVRAPLAVGCERCNVWCGGKPDQ